MSPFPRSPSRQERAWYLRAVSELAVHEWMILAFLLILNTAVLLSDPDPNWLAGVTRVGGLLALFLTTLLLVRGGALDKVPWWRALVYRVGIYGPVQISYFFFKIAL